MVVSNLLYYSIKHCRDYLGTFSNMSALITFCTQNPQYRALCIYFWCQFLFVDLFDTTLFINAQQVIINQTTIYSVVGYTYVSFRKDSGTKTRRTEKSKLIFTLAYVVVGLQLTDVSTAQISNSVISNIRGTVSEIE